MKQNDINAERMTLIAISELVDETNAALDDSGINRLAKQEVSELADDVHGKLKQRKQLSRANGSTDEINAVTDEIKDDAQALISSLYRYDIEVQILKNRRKPVADGRSKRNMRSGR